MAGKEPEREHEVLQRLVSPRAWPRDPAPETETETEPEAG